MLSSLKNKQSSWRTLNRMLTLRQIIIRSTEYLEKHSIETARLDSELLVAHALGLTRLQLYLQLERPLEEEELECARQLLWQRAKKRIPVAYLLGKKEFYGLELLVNRKVLIPRPETELLVELVAKLAPQSTRAIEVGIGSGAISISLAKTLPELEIWATDLSGAALEVARNNCIRHQVEERIRLYKGDLCSPLKGEEGSFQILVSNPPYIPEGELATLAPELGHEPGEALAGGSDGLAVIEPLIRQAFTFLQPGGLIALEIGTGQGQRVAKIAREAGFVDSACHRDYAGLERFFIAWRPKL
jgi:release factor glutamine methyltransferase